MNRHAGSAGGPRIVVIGAGVAGLAAASSLLRHGFNNVLVLEAQDRIGGRVHTVRHDEGVLELGAQWIHGEGDNPLFRLAVKHGLVDSESPGAEGRGEYCTSDGGRIAPGLVAEMEEMMEAADDNCSSFLDANDVTSSDHHNIPPSMEHHFRSTFTQHLRNRKTTNDDEARQLSGLFRWHLVFQCLDNACHCLGRVSAATWGEFRQFQGEHWVNLRGGYSGVVEELASGLPDGVVVQRRKVVSSVSWEGRNRWPVDEINHIPIDSNLDESRNAVNGSKSVHFRNGVTVHIPDDDDDDYVTGQYLGDVTTTIPGDDDATQPHPVRLLCEDGSEYSADHVVVTASLGVLKRCHRHMFQPPLPESKRRVIEAMGFGTLNKIFLVFDRPFWGDSEGFQLVWTDTDELGLRNDDSTPKDQYEWYRDITGFDVVLNQPAVLVGWIGRRGGEIMESLAEQQVGTKCVDLLRRFTGIPDIPYPQKIIRSSWKSNPHVGGSYSNRTVHCDEEAVHTTDLARPVYVDGRDGRRFPVLLFAGEATDTNYFSTVHGAYISGEREARRLISYYTCARMPKQFPPDDHQVEG